MKSLIEKKESLIDLIIEDLQANEYEARGYIYDLVREALRTRTLTQLREQVSDNQPD